MVANIRIYILVPNFAIRQSQGTDFNYDNSNFKFPSIKNPNQAFVIPNFRFFLTPNFGIRQILGHQFRISL